MSNRTRMRGKGGVWGRVLCLLIVLEILIFLCCNLFSGGEGVGSRGCPIEIYGSDCFAGGRCPVRWVFLVEVNFLAKVYLSKVFGDIISIFPCNFRCIIMHYLQRIDEAAGLSYRQ